VALTLPALHRRQQYIVRLVHQLTNCNKAPVLSRQRNSLAIHLYVSLLGAIFRTSTPGNCALNFIFDLFTNARLVPGIALISRPHTCLQGFLGPSNAFLAHQVDTCTYLIPSPLQHIFVNSISASINPSSQLTSALATSAI
jgi:hypothetical protein